MCVLYVSKADIQTRSGRITESSIKILVFVKHYIIVFIWIALFKKDVQSQSLLLMSVRLHALDIWDGGWWEDREGRG